MQLQQVLDHCVSGELHNLNIMDLDRTNINPHMLKSFINALNSGLTDLHTRFLLKKEAVRIRTDVSIRMYGLTLDLDGSSPDYVLDSPHLPFKGNIIEILNIYNKDRNPVKLNAKDGIYITTPQTIYLDGDIVGGVELDVVYKANHARILQDAPMTTEVLIPPSHLKALSYYIGARLMTPQTTGMAAIEGRSFHEGSHYMNLYEKECAHLVELGIDADAPNVVSLFTQRGFI